MESRDDAVEVSRAMTEPMQTLIALLADIRMKLRRAERPSGDPVGEMLDTALDRLEKALHRRPRVLIAGEANSGKTSVANLLAGLEVLPAAVIANTAVPVLLKHGLVPGLTALTESGRKPITVLTASETLPKFLYGGLQRIEVDLPGLHDAGFELLDTPAWQPGSRLAAEADVMVWCSVAGRPWTESERRAIAAIPDRLRARSVLAITHKDTLGAADREKVFRRYRDHASEFFAQLVMVDAAAVSKDERPDERLADSGREQLRGALAKVVDTYWTHRAMTGRRICRHLSRSLKRIVPPSSGPTHDDAPPRNPLAATLSNVAGRLEAA